MENAPAAAAVKYWHIDKHRPGGTPLCCARTRQQAASKCSPARWLLNGRSLISRPAPLDWLHSDRHERLLKTNGSIAGWQHTFSTLGSSGLIGAPSSYHQSIRLYQRGGLFTSMVAGSQFYKSPALYRLAFKIDGMCLPDACRYLQVLL